jgi:hypothetical protein
MKPKPMPEHYFAQIPTTPLQLHPFDPNSKQAALEYGKQLSKLLEQFGVRAELHGSTELEIAGKGEWEFALWLNDQNWYTVIVFLVNHFNGIYTLDDEFALFTEGETEIIAMRGEVALRNQALMHHWRTNPHTRAEYERGKLENTHSKQAYYRFKDAYINAILETL